MWMWQESICVLLLVEQNNPAVCWRGSLLVVMQLGYGRSSYVCC
jgi:hypothetical protein